jgi:hypothetical protein
MGSLIYKEINIQLIEASTISARNKIIDIFFKDCNPEAREKLSTIGRSESYAKTGISPKKNYEVYALYSIQELNTILATLPKAETEEAGYVDLYAIVSTAVRAGGHLTRAELIKKNGEWREQFMSETFKNAAEIIDEVQDESIDYIEEVFSFWEPLIDRGVKNKESTSMGGSSSHGQTPEERQKRNEEIQCKIDSLCIEQGMSFRNACKIVSELWKVYSLDGKSLTAEYIRKTFNNPHQDK